MALQKCHDCGSQVSKSAKECPQCGAPVKKSLLHRNFGCGWLLLILFGIGYMSMPGNNKPQRDRRPPPRQPQSEKPNEAPPHPKGKVEKPSPSTPTKPSSTPPKTTGNAADKALYDAYQKALHQYPDLEEKAVAARVGRRFGIGAEEVQKAWTRVYLGRNSQQGKIETAVKTRLRSIHGKVESVIYQPASASVIIKIKAKDNLTAGLVAKAIKRDLISSTHAGFQASVSVSLVQVWVMAPTSAGVIKVASSSVNRSLYRQLGLGYFKHPIAANVTRLRPWLHGSVK